MIVAAVVVLLATFAQSVTGFGFAMVATPLLLFVLDAKSVVVIIIILGAISTVLVFLHARRHTDIRRVVLLCGGSIFGIPLGAYLLLSLSPVIIKLVIAVSTIPFSVFLLLGHSHQFKRDSLGSGIVGFISGVFITSTSLGGPPVVLFLLNQDLVKERFVGTISAYFLFASLASIVAFSSLDLVTADLLTTVAVSLPSLVLGFYVGIKVRPKINAILFKRLAASIVSVAALVIIVMLLVELI